jgi:hypothetical protein
VRRICSQERYFEAYGMLEVSCQGKWRNVGLIGVEELKIGICRYLWMMSAGEACVRPFFEGRITYRSLLDHPKNPSTAD